MDIKKNDFMGDIYTSYGPFVGKICENTNTQLYKDNNITESLTSLISEKSISENSLNLNINKIDFDKYSPKQPINLNTVNTNVKIPKISKMSKQDIIFLDNTLKTGGNNNVNVNVNEIELLSNDVSNEESCGYLNYKISIFNCKISIWILILILLVIICIGYFIYKYWYLKNNIITYKKNSHNSHNSHNSQNESNESNDILTEKLSSTTSSESDDSVDNDSISISLK